MTTIVDTGVSSPGTHALVIGVGVYDHLIGGPGDPLDNSFGLGQLGSPPISARHFAEWLVSELHNDDAPLASVEVVISSENPTRISTPGAGDIEVEPATMANVQAAANRWFARADTNAGNVAVFYHCGHGLESSDLALLAQDFGAPGGDPPQLWTNACNFHRTYRGMARCKAKGQFFFVDACRQVSADVLQFDGRDLTALVGPKLRGQNATRNAPILYASAREARAFAKSDQVSRFTDALIGALASNGTENRQGRWRVSNTTLGQGVIKRIQFGNLAGVPAQDCIVDGESSGTTTLHVLDHAPLVPAVVSAGGFAPSVGLQFHLNNNPVADLTAAGPSPWQLDVQAGTYSIRAVDGQQVLVDLTGEWVLPPAYEREVP